MSSQHRLFRYLRLFFVALAFVLYPFLVNQIPPLADLMLWFEDVPPIFIGIAALLFAAIVVVGPELLNVKEKSTEDLWKEFARKNQGIIYGRWKTNLYQECHIDIHSKNSPEDLGSLQLTSRQVESPRVESRRVARKPKPTQPDAIRDFQTQWNELRQSVISLLKPVAPLEIEEILPSFELEVERQEQDLETNETVPMGNKSIAEAFAEANRRLLILGEPGSGKTTELLKLALALGKKAVQDSEEPIPVIFELSTWRGEHMLEWMVEQMAAQYGLKPELCRQWISEDRIVPLLDGLDELGEYNDGMRLAVAAIEELQENYEQQQHALVICCRIADYESITAGPDAERQYLRTMKKAVRLCQLSNEQIKDYLEQRLEKNEGTLFWQDLAARPVWLELAKKPMLLNLILITYREGGLPKNVQTDITDCQALLFDEFLARQLPLKDYSTEEAMKYLAWLAASMGKPGINQREFLIEKLQPTWLENARQYRQYRLIVGLIFGLIGGLIFGLIGGLIVGLIFGLIGGLIFGLIVGLIGGLTTENSSIQLTEALDLSWSGIQRGLRQGLIGGLIFGLIVGLIGGLIGGLIFGLIFGLIGGLIFGLIFGLIVGLIFGLIGGLIGGLRADLKVKQRPNQGIQETGIKTLITMGLAMPLCPFIVIVPLWATGQNIALLDSLIFGIGMGVWIGFYAGGGDALVQHFALRWVLSRRGKMPKNYAHFLTQASAAGILKQSGGRFRFYHDTLREHLA
ncbi:NACHT domain-containing protein [Roseofilum casamattae]|uniref:NACHT domain-containing protein n=1 Tax=Roseofilum casamattae BLCC-M143 TaxID=3022442 RepID=A0ABT7BV29_9CYAN|nr:NACHT domain-containing protein [Roseofilum casamattae]MDJ1182138.1 NACHT domain-containing protein [Roseofilum casamattae BLCC-M143]